MCTATCEMFITHPSVFHSCTTLLKAFYYIRALQHPNAFASRRRTVICVQRERKQCGEYVKEVVVSSQHDKGLECMDKGNQCVRQRKPVKSFCWAAKGTELLLSKSVLFVCC